MLLLDFCSSSFSCAFGAVSVHSSAVRSSFSSSPFSSSLCFSFSFLRLRVLTFFSFFVLLVFPFFVSSCHFVFDCLSLLFGKSACFRASNDRAAKLVFLLHQHA